MVCEFYMKNKGFTLTELLISISIIAILVTVAIASYNSVNKQSRDTRRKSDLEQIRSALEMYRSDKGYYPAPLGDTGGTFGPASDLEADLKPDYLPSIPTDPKNSVSYFYTAVSLVGSNYYSYCICGELESGQSSNACSVVLPAASCNYGLKSP